MEVSYSLTIAAPPDRVFALLSDYQWARPTLLPVQYYTDYQVVDGGHGDATVVRWILHFTKSRFRDMVNVVEVEDDLTLVERDDNSTLVTRYTVEPLERNGPQLSLITAQTSWHGADSFMKYLERILAPGMMRKIHAAFLTQVKNYLQETPAATES
ncbi:SRPBCC family protein [Mycolicibacterium brisbanense]|uniref:Polyketide cyclase / dehydrase and lipid transport n=1 Tax=Mycolicibacterium brisbanense TaxID=146020 RepID=A0A117I7A1_9MYCO|nr:SRPBCC family protein [Mycolicibacterium brisbanense]MCV7157088.1 SRPBCC family protein [Mycolicibacterium brisbanense]GAS91352.1 uncharacterized protein RMCB_5448 [Mycolicibacterium brisbanense]